MPKHQQIVPVTPPKPDDSDEVKVAQWQELGQSYALSGEWAVAQRLGETVSDEQIDMIANLYGR